MRRINAANRKCVRSGDSSSHECAAATGVYAAVVAMGRAYRIIDATVFVLCIPFYLVMFPTIGLIEWWSQRRRVRIGKEVTHWPLTDVREDYLAVDVSRTAEGLVGIRRRRYGLLRREGPPPPYGDTVEFIPVPRFWVPEPFFSSPRSAPPGAGPT